jgi:hypothetical protein
MKIKGFIICFAVGLSLIGMAYCGSKMAKAGYGDSVIEIKVTDHSSYVVDRKFGLCFYEQKDGAFVIQIEGNICEELIHAR